MYFYVALTKRERLRARLNRMFRLFLGCFHIAVNKDRFLFLVYYRLLIKDVGLRVDSRPIERRPDCLLAG